jgi:TonB family protein
MASILVVGQEQRSLERFHRVLSAEGWRVRVAQGRAQALQAAALEPPDLVLAGAEMPGAEELAGAFRRSAGGPGIVVVLPETGVPTGPAVLGDDRLRLPFGDQDLVAAVRRMLAVAREATGPAAAPVRLTSQEIFGDVLAEVEGELGGRPLFPPASPPPRPQPAAATVPTPRPQLSRGDSEIQRKLEETLSGVLGMDARAARTAAAPAPAASSGPSSSARRGDTGGLDVEALLSKALSELGAPRPRPAAAPAAAREATGAGAAPSPPSPASSAATRAVPPAPAPTTARIMAPAASAVAPAASAAAPAASAPAGAPASGRADAPARSGPLPIPIPPASVAAPAALQPSVASSAASAAPAAPAAESTGVRRRFTGELDLSQIEELARTRRKADTSSRPVIPAPVPIPPAPPAIPPPPPVAAARIAESSAATQRIAAVPREPAEAGEKFGQYTLLERIAVGGMAEVWKARMRGVEGFQKTVAIKKILPYMTDNAAFVSMFIDEAKLAAQLSHPNIIHIYDLGKIGSDYYIAMEYVEGKDLRSLLNAARQRGVALPLGLALLIAVRLGSALDYAHRKRDFEGREMGLVHRDVSPQNVLISYDGDVKLCDFGIAKAVLKVGQTHTGALKGKLQYMSPEQAMGKPVDARSDIFSLGAILFEMLTGQRLFDGDSEMSVLEAVRQVKVRSPRQVDPAVPREVDDVVMHALAGRPEDRFQTSGELEQRLEALLYALKPSPSHSDLAAFVRRALEKPVPAARADRQAQPPPPLPPRPPLQGPAAAAVPLAPVAAAATAAALPLAAAPPPAAQAATPAHAAPSIAPAPSERSAGLAAPVADAAPTPAPLATVAPLAPLTPLAPLDGVVVEEGSRPGRLMLAAAVAALVVAGLLTYFLIGRRNSANPVPGAPAAGSHAAGAPAPRTGPGGAVQPGGLAGQPPPPGGAPAAGKAAPPGAGKTDVQGVVDQELARRAEEMKQKFEEQQKQLQKEIDKTKNGKPQAETAVSAATAAASGSSGSAQPAPNPPTPANAAAGEPGRSQQRSAAAQAAESRPAAEAPASTAAAAASAAPQDAARERPADAAGRTQRETAGGSPAVGSSAAGGTAGTGAVTVPPKLVSSPKPEYPPLARKLGVEGVVVLSVLVDEQGHVEDVQLLEPVSQNVGINEAALRVARSAQFKPATRDGAHIKMWTRLRIPFKH